MMLLKSRKLFVASITSDFPESVGASCLTGFSCDIKFFAKLACIVGCLFVSGKTYVRLLSYLFCTLAYSFDSRIKVFIVSPAVDGNSFFLLS